jgi:predicted enzyme related to lactoylglutathione lyase
MAQVTGVGGVFIRAKAPEELAAWYERALGVPFGADGGTSAVLPDTGAAYAVLAFFPNDSDYLGDPKRQTAMVNLRVDDIDAVCARLDELGIDHDAVEDSEYGRFGWVVDPEGNRVELWQPPADA